MILIVNGARNGERATEYFSNRLPPLEVHGTVDENQKKLVEKVWKDFQPTLEANVNRVVASYFSEDEHFTSKIGMNFRRNVIYHMEYYYRHYYPVYVKNNEGYYNKPAEISGELLDELHRFIEILTNVL